MPPDLGLVPFSPKSKLTGACIQRIAYACQTLQLHKCNYAATEMEALGVA